MVYSIIIDFLNYKLIMNIRLSVHVNISITIENLKHICVRAQEKGELFKFLNISEFSF